MLTGFGSFQSRAELWGTIFFRSKLSPEPINRREAGGINTDPLLVCHRLNKIRPRTPGPA